MRRALVLKSGTFSGMVHCLSAVAEARQRIPELRVDWVAEERFRVIPILSPAVDRVYSLGFDRWRAGLFSMLTWREVLRAIAPLKDQRYDLVIDAQGMLRTAWVGLQARVPQSQRWGFASGSSSSAVGSMLLNHQVPVPYGIHAVDRQRRLLSAALGFELGPRPVSGSLVAVGMMAEDFEDLCHRIQQPATERPNWVVMVTGSGRGAKAWPDQDWIRLGRALQAQGLLPLLPASGTMSRGRAHQIASACGGKLLPMLSLIDVAGILQHARAVVGVDTGLTHWAAAMGQSTVALLHASPYERFHVDWTLRGLTLTDDEISVEQVLEALGELGVVDRAALDAAAEKKR
ncbi:MAG: hypothetical protein RLY30_1088 [Pseudomonadota bacterium]|jgi:heptosyltransferase-1